jgi:VanZ family protein
MNDPFPGPGQSTPPPTPRPSTPQQYPRPPQQYPQQPYAPPQVPPPQQQFAGQQFTAQQFTAQQFPQPQYVAPQPDPPQPVGAQPAASQPATPPPLAPPEPPPAKVAQAATDRALGAIVAAQKGSNPLGNFVFGIGAAVVLIGVGLGVAWLAAQIGFRALAYLALLCFVGALIAVVLSFAALLAGFTATYLYAGGVVHTKNGKVQVVAWPDLDEMLLWRAGGKSAIAGTLLCYYLITFDGRKVPIEKQSAKGDKALGEHLQQIVKNIGRPVVDSGPYTGRLRV